MAFDHLRDLRRSFDFQEFQGFLVLHVGVSIKAEGMMDAPTLSRLILDEFCGGRWEPRVLWFYDNAKMKNDLAKRLAVEVAP